MPTLETLALETSTLGIALVMVVCGLALIVFLPRRGGFELALTHVASDPQRRRVFLWALSLTLTAFVADAVADSLESLMGSHGAATAGLGTVLFLAGAAGILLLMVNALRAPPLSLQEQWTIRENAERARVADSLSPSPQGPRSADASDPDPPQAPGR